MQITINDKTREVNEGITIDELLSELPVKPQLVAITRNGAFIRKDDYQTTQIEPGDALQVIAMLAGG